jgi:hypothetical protein
VEEKAMRGADKQPRKRRTRAEIEAEEFMPGRVARALIGNEEPEPEPEIQELKVFARNIFDDPEYRQNVQDRARTGRLLPLEMKMLVEAIQTAPPRPSPTRDKWKPIFEAATRVETQMIANICRRAMGEPEMPIYLDGQTVARLNYQITGEKQSSKPLIKPPINQATG